jgi:DUF1680 family protein
MITSRRDLLRHLSCGCAGLTLRDVFDNCMASVTPRTLTAGIDQMRELNPGAVEFHGYLQRYIERSLEKWIKGTIPYEALAGFFRTGRPTVSWEGHRYELFAAGEMWGKAVRSAALFYRYTGDPELKVILKRAVGDLLKARRENGTISCAPIDRQPDGPGGDIWERKYVLLGLDDYYAMVEQDPEVLAAMIAEADATLRQVGPPPKIRIVDLGWSPNKIESSTILEPILKLYKRTGYPRYLEFARYIVESEGGAKNHNIFQAVLADVDPVDLAGIYPKAYEMLSLFEGLTEYYRATGNEQWREACLRFFHKVIAKEITLIGNGGGDEPYHPNVAGEAWDNTALEQTNPDIRRMMETCTGVTWLKYCYQMLRLTADPIAVDYIELYAYNGLIGAMVPSGEGFSYVNLLNGVKTNAKGWGTEIKGVYVTCCNLNGPEGLAYLPLVALMQDSEGPIVNLYNPATTTVAIGGAGGRTTLKVVTDYPLDGDIRIEVTPSTRLTFAVKLRIPSWSHSTTVRVNDEQVPVRPGTYARIERSWSPGDVIHLTLDMRCRLVSAPHGTHAHSDQFRALIRGPIVLARDENIDSRFDEPVDIVATDGIVAVKATKTTLPDANMEFSVPTRKGTIQMVDYASVNSWLGKRIQTWLPVASTPKACASPC